MRSRLVGLAFLAMAACGGGDGPSDPGTSARGSLRGTVTLNTGGAVAGATIRLTGNNQAARTATSAADGSYTITNIPTGTYTLAITPPTGFAPSGTTTQNVTISANQEAVVGAFVLLQSGPGTVPALVDVSMVNTSFQPQAVEVAVGGTVRWTNNDAVTHNATGTGISTGNMGQGAVREEVMTTAGTVNYACTLHAGMTGTITVR